MKNCKTCGAPARIEYCSIKCAESDKQKRTAVQLKAAAQEREALKADIIDRLRRKTGFSFCTEYQFDQNRKWRFDYALPEKMIAVEIEGGVWSGGRHTRGKGYIGDMEKYNTAQLLGWRVLRFTPSQIEEMLEAVKEVCK